MKPERSTDQPAAAGESTAKPSSATRKLLDEVIQETLTAEAAEACGESWTGLLEVARRYPQPTLEVDPVLIALVESILGPRFQKALDDGATWKQMTTTIATTLYEDPAARDRLDQLWARLQEASRE